jgi:hypothetical protein
MSEFKSWEEMSELEQAQCMFWDMYKDAHGVRPRGIDTSAWTLADFHKEFEYLSQVNDQEEAQRRAAEDEAVRKFEQHVINTICMGAGDRATALRWIMDASSAEGDWEYFCFLNGLPYYYFKEAA